MEDHFPLRLLGKAHEDIRESSYRRRANVVGAR